MIKRRLLFIYFFILPFFAAAQQRTGFARLIPQHIKLQFAGSIGFLSAGFGYESPNKRFQGDFFYGYVPESVGGVTIHSVTAKLTWMAVWKELKMIYALIFLRRVSFSIMLLANNIFFFS
ncbi:MAG: hypothetical protein WDO16_13705 [Bacteroidota bacterium]